MRFSNLFECAFVRRVKRRICIRMVRLARSAQDVVMCFGSGLPSLLIAIGEPAELTPPLPARSPSSAGQWFRLLGIRFWSPEQLCNGNIQGFCEAFQEINRRVLLLPLNAADVSPIHAGIVRKLLLREALAYPYPSQIPSQQSAAMHPAKSAGIRL